MPRGRSSILTKEEIARSLEECLQKKSLDKITIIDITEGSGVSRQMFYHYFTDRADLIRFICGKYVRTPLYGEKMFCWEKSILRLICSKEEYGLYYRNILNSKYANLLRKVIEEELYQLYYCVIRYRICRTLPNELVDMLRTHSAASAKILCQWLADDEKDTAEGIRDTLYEMMPMQIKILLTERVISIEEIFRERKLLSWAYNG